MRNVMRWGAVVFVCAVAVIPSGTAQAQADRNCPDFAFQEDAQAFFEGQGPGDPHNLDADDDGIACETLPRRASGPAAPAVPDAPRDPATARTARIPRTPRIPRASLPAGGDRDCDDFRTQAEAQSFFRTAGAGDPHRLDDDDDGIACETLRRVSLPATGTRVRTFGLTGASLLVLGALCLLTARRSRIVSGPSKASGPPAWGDEPLVGW